MGTEIKLTQKWEKDKKQMGMIIVARHESLTSIKLFPMDVNYDQTVEEMIAEYALRNSAGITSEHFPRIQGKTGMIEESLVLVRMQEALADCARSDDGIERIVAVAGYELTDWPSLGPLKTCDHDDELWSSEIQYVVARGSNSRWQDSSVTYGVSFRPWLNRYRFGLSGLGFARPDVYGWYLCRKLSRSSGI